MFPRLGRLHLCAFSDEALYGEVAQKSAFFQAPDFYGVDLTALHAPATAGYFGQVRASLLLLVVVVVCARVCWGRGGRG
jgi:hypothetical protein